MTQSFIKEAVGKRNFSTLDALRGVAAVLVVMHHYENVLHPIFVGSAYLAVDMFFMISGFVLANAYEDRLTNGMSARRFLLLRILRLYPLYILGVAIAAIGPIMGVVTHMSRDWTASTLIMALSTSLFMLPNVVGHADPIFPLNIPAWSLFYELLVNFVFAAILPLKLRYLWAIVFVSAVGLIALSLTQGSLASGSLWSNWWGGPVRTVFSFFAGVLAKHIYYRNERLPWLRISPWFALISAAVLLCITPPDHLRALYDLLCVVALLPTIVWLSICNEPVRGLKLFAFLGLISYPIYALHVPVLDILSKISDRILHIDLPHHGPWVGLILLIALIPLSWFLAQTYDVWARAALARRFSVAVNRVA